MNKKMKKRASITAVLLLNLAVLAGCSGGNSNSAAGSSGNDASSKSSDAGAKANTSQTASSYNGTGPVTTDPSAKLSILATNAYTSNVDLSKAQTVNEIAKKAGVQIDWQLLPPANYQDAVAPRLASGSNLPDVVYLIPPDPADKYIRSGIFQPLNKLFDKYGVNLKKLYGEKVYAAVKAMLTAPDGNIYYVPQLTETTQYVPAFMVNTRWLKDLNLQAPTTLDDFTNMLKAFKSYDANHDGKKNVIPFSINKANIEQAFGPVFGLEFPFYADKNGKVHYAYYTPEYKEFLTYLNGLYKDGLMDSDFANTTRDQITSRFAQNTTGATFDFSYSSSMIYSKAIKDYDPKDPLIEAILPLKGPHGDQFYVTRNPISGVFGITKDSKNAETAFKFLDYAIGPEAQDIYTWGDKDVTYTEVDGKKQWTDKGKDNAFIQKYGINPVNMPIIQSASGVDMLVPKWHVDMDRKIEPYVKAPFPFVYDLPDEASLEDQTMPDINTFVNEKEINFITGKEGFDQFDNFEKTLKGMNIEDVIKAKQAQYDRYQAALKK